MARLLDRPGIWNRAGMNGAISGLLMAEAMASLPAGCDPEMAKRLLVIAEAAFVAATMRKVEADGDNDNR